MNNWRSREWSPARVCLRLLANFLKILLIKKVVEIGRENVPLQGPVVITPNHFSTGEDPGVLFILIKNLVILYKKELEGTNLISFLPGLIVRIFLRGAGFIPTRRDRKDLDAGLKMYQELRSGSWVLGMLEGTSRHHGLIEGRRRGIAREAMRANCLVLPVGLIGTTHALTDPLHGKGRHTITVIWGKPFCLSDLGLNLSNDPEGRLAAEQIMIRVGCLLPKNLRGYYESQVETFLLSRKPHVDFYRNLQPQVQDLS